MEAPGLEDMDDGAMDALDVEDAGGGMLGDEAGGPDGDPWVRCAQHQSERPPDSRHEAKELCNRCRDARSRAYANDLKLITKKANSLYPRTGRHVAVIQFEAAESKRAKMRVFGSPLARTAVTSVLGEIQRAWRSSLMANVPAAPGTSIPPPTRHNGVRVAKLGDMTIADLRVYVPALIRAAEDRLKPGYSKAELRPAWWDREWSSHCVHSGLSRDDLLHLVRSCFRHYNRLDLLAEYQGQDLGVAQGDAGVLHVAYGPAADLHSLPGLAPLAPLPAAVVDVMGLQAKAMAIPPALAEDEGDEHDEDDEGHLAKRSRTNPSLPCERGCETLRVEGEGEQGEDGTG